METRRAVARLAALVAALCALLPATADAAFPGPNGKLVFANGDVYVMNADGSGLKNLTVSTGLGDSDPVWSPDGTRIAWQADAPTSGPQYNVYVMYADGTQPRRVTQSVPDCAGAGAPGWSPDGSRIVFTCRDVNDDAEIWTVNADGSGTGLTRLTNNAVRDASPTWSPDGSQIAWTSQDELWVMNADGTGQTRLTFNEWPLGALVMEPEWSPDGSRIAYTRACLYDYSPGGPSCAQGEQDIYTVNPDGTGSQLITPAVEYFNHPAWSPDGTKISVSSCSDPYDCPTNEIRVMNADGTGLTTVHTRAYFIYGLNWQPDLGLPIPATPIEPGQIAFVSYRAHDTSTLQDDRAAEIYTMNLDGSRIRRLTFNEWQDSDPEWSADGRKIAFAGQRDHPFQEGYTEVYTMNSDGSGEVRLTNDQDTVDSNPTWSPDGTRIAFRRYATSTSGPSEIWVMDSNGSNAQRLLPPVPGGDEDPDWSPDGTRIAFSRNGDIWSVRPDGTDLARLTEDSRFDGRPEWSPSGASIAFDRYSPYPDETPTNLWFMTADGGNETQFTFVVDPSGAYGPSWTPDGRNMVFNRDRDIYLSQGNTNLTNTTGSDYDPDVQPVLGYPRPKGATPARFSLVTAYRPCTAPDREHGPPLAFASCSAPQKASQHLTVGTGDANGKPALNEGYVTFGTVVGVPSTPADEADVRLEMFVDDVFTQSLADYAGELRATFTVRVTDRNNAGTGPATAGTTADIPLAASFACTGVPDPQEGSTCSGTTTIDALIPGAVGESKRSVWQLDQVRVFDGGADGDGDTVGDNTLFATAGLFVP